jgi:serine/threonine protein phosphatase PrpC
MLGQSFQNYGEIHSAKLGHAVAQISVGGTPDSPSKASKGNLNEDGLLVIQKGSRYLLAVADGHFGNQTSHALLKRLSGKPFPESPNGLVETLFSIQEPALMVGSGSTLVAAVYDQRTGTGFGAYTGDSTLAVMSDGTFHRYTEDNTRFVYFNNPLGLEEWKRLSFHVPPGGMLLLYTDGINECHYRSPETSVKPEHMTILWDHTGDDAPTFSRLLTQLALDGVGGYPGGQDNIALIALSRAGL